MLHVVNFYRHFTADNGKISHLPVKRRYPALYGISRDFVVKSHQNACKLLNFRLQKSSFRHLDGVGVIRAEQIAVKIKFVNSQSIHDTHVTTRDGICQAVCVKIVYSAEFAVIYHLFDFGDSRMISEEMSRHQNLFVLFGKFYEVLCFRMTHRHRLFNEDIFSGEDCVTSQREMRMRRRYYIHGVNLGIFENLFVVGCILNLSACKFFNARFVNVAED